MQPSLKHPGTRDYFPTRFRNLQSMIRQAEGLLESYGYQSVTVPTLEEFSLHEGHAWGGVFETLFYFTDREGKKLVLRPDFTRSVVRMASLKLTHLPPPIRLGYSGKVYRFQPRDSGELIEFYQVGAELLGARSPDADAEVLSLAMLVPTNLGVTDVTARVTEPRIVTELLRGAGLDPHGHAALLAAVIDGDGVTADDRALPADVVESLGKLDPVERLRLLDGVIEVLELPADGPRGARALRQLLRRALSSGESRTKIGKLRAALDQLRALTGDLNHALPEARALLPSLGLDASLLDHVTGVAAALDAYKVPNAQVRLDLGLRAPFAFYTGLYFSVTATVPDPAGTSGTLVQRELGCGGRYDPILDGFGGAAFRGGTGFAVLVEEILRVVRDTRGGRAGETEVVPGVVQVVAGGVSSARIREAAVLAENLRVHGLKVALSPEPGSMDELRKSAEQLGADWIVFGEERRWYAAHTAVDTHIQVDTLDRVFEFVAGRRPAGGNN